MIDRAIIEEILLRTDIHSLIGSYVSLKRSGSNLKGLCPFHGEKTPSFTVYTHDNSFYCFGCGAGGDQISFTMRMENLAYADAVKFLGKRVGITVVDTEEYTSGPKIDRERLYTLNQEAARWFHENLKANNPEANAAMSYFVDKRKMDMGTIKHFGLGYAPKSFDALLKHFLSKGYTEEELLLADLISKSERGHYYDKFRGRVIFPIIDVSGRVIAFGGRVLDDSKPKYLNSSDTPVFKKLRNLFALNYARHASSESIILCEGYADVISLHAAGFTNAVATLGTAINSEQARMLKNYTKRVIICYDSDEAGQKATTRAMKILEEYGVDVSVLHISGAKDPDEYIKQYGSSAFRSLVDKPKSKFQFVFDNILGRFNISDPQQKIDALAELEKAISEIYSEAERDVYIDNVSKRFNVSFDSIKADVAKIVRRNQLIDRKKQTESVRQTTMGHGDSTNPDFIKAPVIARNEENVLGLLLIYPEYRHKVFAEDLLSEEDFVTELNHRIFIYLKDAHSSGNEKLPDINETFTPEQVSRIVRMKIERMEIGNNSEQVLLESIDTLRRSLEKKETEKVSTATDLEQMLAKIRENSN